MRNRVALLCALSVMWFAGCEQRIPKGQLGNVVFQVPAVPGSDKPPAMPELEGIPDAPASPHMHH
jgi:hypothetical protein